MKLYDVHTEPAMQCKKREADRVKADLPRPIGNLEIRLVREVARGRSWRAAAALVFPVMPDQERHDLMREFRQRDDVQMALSRERLLLSDAECVTRSEKRHVLSKLIRSVENDTHDPDVVLKAIQLDNRMTGDEEVKVVREEVYVVRCSDVIELDDDDVVG